MRLTGETIVDELGDLGGFGRSADDLAEALVHEGAGDLGEQRDMGAARLRIGYEQGDSHGDLGAVDGLPIGDGGRRTASR